MLDMHINYKQKIAGAGAAGCAGLACLLLMSMIMAVSGCGIFDTRDAFPPGDKTTGKVGYITPNDASQVLANLKSGLENLDGANYFRSLSDDFNFIPLLDDEVDLGSATFADWDVEVEKAVVAFMVSGPDTIKVDFNPEIIINEISHTRFRCDYVLRIVTNSPRVVNVYRGVAELDIRGGSGQWKLELWREIEPVGSFTTWGYRRGEIRNQIV
jgi:hypothetical protein